MFKRVEKRRKKKRDEEELGLDEDMKDVLGLQDTDSEESDSELDPDESSNDGGDSDDGASEEDGIRETQGRKRKRDGGEHEEAYEEVDEEADDELEDSGGEDDKQPTLTIQEALKDPLYNISLQPDTKGCIVCPGKLLKNVQMYNVHKESKAHRRRFKLFAQVAANARQGEDAWDVLQTDVSPQTAKTPLKSPEELSKRAEKRNAKTAAVKAKREKQKALKAKAIAKKAAKAASPDVDSTDLSLSKAAKPAKKKRKTDPTTDDASHTKAEEPPSAVALVKAPKKLKQHLVRGATKGKARSELLKQTGPKAQALGHMETPAEAKKSPEHRGKPKPHRTKKV